MMIVNGCEFLLVTLQFKKAMEQRLSVFRALTLLDCPITNHT